jgi:hypothetical protein
MAANQLSKGIPDGTLLGQSASDLIAFHGGTPTSQATFVADQSINALSVSGVIGFTTSASFSSAIGKINSILTLLRTHGLMAAS